MVSAFGQFDHPATNGIDPIVCATKLARFTLDNYLDGVDVDFEDTNSFKKGVGEKWLIDFTRRLREILPGLLITHAPQAVYFEEERYPNGGYMAVHREVGQLIDFYNVQFYNQMGYTYDTYATLFTASSPGKNKGSSVG